MINIKFYVHLVEHLIDDDMIIMLFAIKVNLGEEALSIE